MMTLSELKRGLIRGIQDEGVELGKGLTVTSFVHMLTPEQFARLFFQSFPLYVPWNTSDRILLGRA